VRILVIHNPVAGRGRRRRLRKLLKTLAAHGHDTRTRLTTHRGDAREVARTSKDTDVIIAAGGDGTVNEIVNGLAARRPDQPLPAVGFLPLGTANVLAWELGLPCDPDGLVRMIEGGQVLQVMPGKANDDRFALMASVGVDARAVAAVGKKTKRVLGWAAYVLAALRAIRQAPPRLRVSIDGQEVEARTVIVTRARCYGGPFVLATDAGLYSDGLHVVMLQSYGLMAALRYGIALLLKRLAQLDDVTVTSGRHVEIRGPADEPVQMDGDVTAVLPLDVSIDRRPVPFLVPESAAATGV